MTHAIEQMNGVEHLGGIPATCYTIFLPLHYNDGRPIEPAALYQTQQRILYYAGGLTRLAQAEGFWVSSSGQVARDTILPVQAIVPTCTEANIWFTCLAAELAMTMDQEEIFLVAQPLMMVNS